MLKLVSNQKLWFVGAGNFRRHRGEVTVTSVGRKWAQISGVYNGRIAVDTLAADGAGYPSAGQCYASEQAWAEQEGPKHAWQALRLRMPTECPEGLSVETIAQAAKLLGVDISAPPKAC